MHTIVITAINKGAGLFPQSTEDGYNVIKEMQQVLPHVSRGSTLVS